MKSEMGHIVKMFSIENKTIKQLFLQFFVYKNNKRITIIIFGKIKITLKFQNMSIKCLINIWIPTRFK